jgi:hypothetical protein
MAKMIAFWISALPLPVSSVALMTVRGALAKAIALAIAALATIIVGIGSRRTRGGLVWRRASMVAALPGIAAGALMMALAGAHNSQGEFFEGKVVHWGYWFSVGLTWFVPTYAFILALGVIWFGADQPAVAADGAPPRR